MQIDRETAVLVVDVQGDFTEVKQGSLAVPGTDQAYIEAVARQTRCLRDLGCFMVATQDWHPAGHISFFTSHPGRSAFDLLDLGDRTQVLWPPHCVQGSENAGLLLDRDLFDAVIQKGRHPEFDSYSGFFDDGGHGTGLEDLLKEKGIRRLILYGLATDYCVRATALDARSLGFEAVLFQDLCRGVDRETTRAALETMAAARVVVTRSSVK